MDDAVKALDAVLAGTEPLTEEQVDKAQYVIMKRAWNASREHRDVAEKLAKAEADAAKAYLDAHAESLAMHEERRVAHHDTVARLAAADAEGEALMYRMVERSLRKEMELLESLTSSLQTQKKSFRLEHAA